jgi:hypothetical protein
MKLRTITAIFILALLMAGPAGASLTKIGSANYGSNSYNLIYDNDGPFGSIVYLDYTNSYTTWADQITWASSLNTAIITYNLNPGYSMNWSSGWRLPNTVDGPYSFGHDGTSTAGYNITTSEMGHLYYTELGNKGYVAADGMEPQAGWGLTSTGLFSNLQSDWYWSGTGYTNDSSLAWAFDAYAGAQFNWGTVNPFLALAVRTGQLSEAVPVPEPSTMLLLGVGLAGLAGVRLWRHGR